MEKGQGERTDTSTRENVFTRKEYIEREAVREMIAGFPCTMSVCLTVEECKGMRRAKEIILKQMERIPAADVVSVRHGRWKKVDDGIYYHMECSECGCRPLRNRWVDDNELSLFCPNCGARMGGDEE